jgi:outer membrane protein TolC
LDLQGAFRIGHLTAREFLSAEEDYIVGAISLLIERHLWGPRFFNDTSVTLSGQGDQGSFQHTLEIINDLRVTQRLPYGGAVEAGWVWDATEQLRQQATGRYRQSSELALSAEIPLLRGAGLVAQEDLIQAERDLIYRARSFERFRREFLVQIAQDYFELIELLSRIANQESQVASLKVLEEGTAERVKAGRLSAFELNLTTNQVLQATSELLSLREQFILAIDRFKVRLGLDVDRPLKILPLQFDIPEPEIGLQEATALAMQLRLDLQNQRDRLDDARRAVANARNALLPDLTVKARVGVPTDPLAHEGRLSFDIDETTYLAGLTLGLPLDRQIERLRLKQASIGVSQQQRRYEQDRDSVVVGVRSALRQIELARNQLTLAEMGVQIAERRLEEQKLKADLVEPQKIVDSENDLLDARNSRDQSLTNLRNAVLNYLLQSDQLRVKRDGTIEPLPGLEGVAPRQPVD